MEFVRKYQNQIAAALQLVICSVGVIVGVARAFSPEKAPKKKEKSK